MWNSPLVRGALLLVATLLCYLPAAHCGYIWDDEMYVTENPLLTAPDGLWRIWFSFDSPSQYFPLVYTTFRLEHALWGLAPLGYHSVNILLHAVNALLLWRLLRRLEIPGAWLAAAIFALHPVQVESVAWVTELKNVEMGFFFLLSLLAWTAFHERRIAPVSTTPRPGGSPWGFYALSLGFYALALFSKTTACTLPAALLIILWWRAEPIGWRRLVELLPYVALGLGMGLLTVWWERYHQGTQGTLFTMGLAQRFVIAGRGVWFYLEKLFWPANLTFSYPQWTLSAANPSAYVWGLAFCGLAAAAFLARPRVGRGPLAALAFFVATLGPVLGFLMLYTFRYSFVADHYQYLASIGPIALVAAGGATLAARHPNFRGVVGGCGALILLTLGILTWKQCHVYLNDESIWRDTVRKNPGSLIAHFDLADILKHQGDYAASLVHYDRVVQIDPSFFEARCKRGDVLAQLGRLPEAAADYQAALAMQPGNAGIHNGYGSVLEKMGAAKEAAAQFQEAIRLDPHYPVAKKNLADLLASQGNFAAALPYYEEVARLFPNEPRPHLLLARAAASVGRIPDAIREYREAVRLAPEWAEAITRLAWLLATCDDPQLRNGAEAVPLAQRACALTHHQNSVALNTLAAAYAADGRFPDAVTTGRLAIDAAMKAGDTNTAADYQRQTEIYEKQAAVAHPPAAHD
jgi:tetratricopeptide (TPR) repeat protein